MDLPLSLVPPPLLPHTSKVTAGPLSLCPVFSYLLSLSLFFFHPSALPERQSILARAKILSCKQRHSETAEPHCSYSTLELPADSCVEVVEGG